MVSRYIILALAVPAVAYGQFFGPDNYDECITESMKGVTSDVAARAIIRSCRAQFPPMQVESRDLTRDELANVTGRGARSILPGVGVKFLGDVYNGNPSVTLVEVTIAITAEADDPFTEESETVTRTYSTPVVVLPQSTAKISVGILDEQGEYTWYIAAAKGHE